MHAAGGPDEFLDSHAVIVMSDHSQIAVVDQVNLASALDSYALLRPDRQEDEAAEIAICPSQRSAKVYVLDPGRRSEMTAKIGRELNEVEGVDVVMWLDPGSEEAVVVSERGELRFTAGGELAAERGGGWRGEGARAGRG